MSRTEDRVDIDETDIAHSVGESVYASPEGLSTNELEILELSSKYHQAKLDAIRETYNSRFAQSRNIFRTSKLSNFSERMKGRGKKMAFRSGTAFVLNYSSDALSLIPVTIPGAIVATAVAGALGTGYDSFVNKQTFHRLYGYRTTQEFLTAKETLEPERLKGKKREYKDLVDRLDACEYTVREDIEADLAQVKTLIRTLDIGMIYNARAGVEVRISTDKTAENKGWVEVDGLEKGLGYLYAKNRELATKLVQIEEDSDKREEILVGLLPLGVSKQKDRLISEVVDEKIKTLLPRIKREQNRMWVSETVISTGIALTGGLIVGKWAERTFGWGQEVAKVTKSTLNQYFEYHQELFINNPLEFKGTLSTVADAHIADQIEKAIAATDANISLSELSLREFADFKGITDGSQFRSLFEQEYLNNATSEDIKKFLVDAGNVDLETTEGALEFVKSSGMDRFALDPQTDVSMARIFTEKEIVTNTDLVSIMKRNPRVFGNLDSRYIGEVKYFDAVSRMPQEDLDRYMQSLGTIDSHNYTADAALAKLQIIANESGVRYENKLIKVPLVENYRVISGDSVYQILEKNNIALDSPESAKFVSDNREILRITASNFGNSDELDALLTKIDAGEINALSDDYSLSNRALHWINTGDQFSITTGFEERVERVAIGADPEWLKPIVRVSPENISVLPSFEAPQEVITSEKIIDLRNARIPDRLEIASVGINADVNEVKSLINVDYPYLSRSFAGHIAESGAMGYEDWPNKNMIIGGHVSYLGNPAVFFNLNKVQVGALIKITDVSGTETFYKVSSLSVIHESEIGQKVKLASNDEILTLITCQYAQNDNKIVVVAEKFNPLASLAMSDEQKINLVKSQIDSIKQVFSFSAKSPEQPKTVTGIDELRKLKEAILAKVA